MVNRLKLMKRISILNFWLRYQPKETKSKINILLSKIFENENEFDYCKYIAERVEHIVYTDKDPEILELIQDLFERLSPHAKG